MGLRVTVWRTGEIAGQCCCCGRAFMHDNEIGTLYDLGAFQGHICERCLELGPMGAGDQMHRLAERLDLLARRMVNLDPEKWPKTRPATEAQADSGDVKILGAIPGGSVGALREPSVTGEKAF